MTHLSSNSISCLAAFVDLSFFPSPLDIRTFVYILNYTVYIKVILLVVVSLTIGLNYI